MSICPIVGAGQLMPWCRIIAPYWRAVNRPMPFLHSFPEP